MKKFLKKKSVMVTFLTLAVIFLIIYTSLLVRPGTTLLPYKGEYETMGVKTKIEVVFKGGKKADIIKTTLPLGSQTTEHWVHFDGYNVFIGMSTKSMDKDDFCDFVEDLEEDYPKIYKESLTNVNVFKMEYMGIELVNSGAIVFAVVGGAVEIVLIAFAAMSIMASKSKKK